MQALKSSDKSSKLDENVLVQTAEHSDPIINRGGASQS